MKSNRNLENKIWKNLIGKVFAEDSNPDVKCLSKPTTLHLGLSSSFHMLVKKIREAMDVHVSSTQLLTRQRGGKKNGATAIIELLLAFVTGGSSYPDCQFLQALLWAPSALPFIGNYCLCPPERTAPAAAMLLWLRTAACGFLAG